MSTLDALAACAGSWRGTNKLHDPHNNVAEESAGTAAVTPVLGGKFVRMDYTWEYQGKPQEGSLLIGCDAREDTLTAHWIDSWHMGNKVMACSGPGQAGPVFSVRGSYAAPPGPDWGWRIEITPGDSELRLVMVNIWPEGKEELAVEAVYVRKEAA
jgi:hypothetical protein